jgi:CheY-like chemotaxis protein
MPTATRSHLVIVDDTDDDVFLLKRLLERAGVKNPVTALHSAQEAMEFLRRELGAGGGGNLPLLCFLDVKMPGQDGFDLLKWIRSCEGLEGMPVVMLSSSEEQADVHKAARLGAQCYFAKFPPRAALLEAIQHAARTALWKSRGKTPPFACSSNLLA